MLKIDKICKDERYHILQLVYSSNALMGRVLWQLSHDKCGPQALAEIIVPAHVLINTVLSLFTVADGLHDGDKGRKTNFINYPSLNSSTALRQVHKP